MCISFFISLFKLLFFIILSIYALQYACSSDKISKNVFAISHIKLKKLFIFMLVYISLFFRGGNLPKTPGSFKGKIQIVSDFYRLKPPRWPSFSAQKRASGNFLWNSLRCLSLRVLLSHCCDTSSEGLSPLVPTCSGGRSTIRPHFMLFLLVAT